MSPEERNHLAGEIATGIGMALRQEYRKVGGEWWLFTTGNPARALKPDEVEWHIARRHHPFVADGLKPGDADWWNDPDT